MTTDKIKLFIVDRDPIFRLGLHTGIAQSADFTIVGEGDISNYTFRRLTQGLVLNILVIGISSHPAEAEIAGLEFCQQFRKLYPQLPIFLLASNLSARNLAKIKSWGIRGYCDRSSNIDTVIAGLHSVAYGNIYWQTDGTSPKLWQKFLGRISQPGRVELERALQSIEAQLANRDLSDWERVFLIGRKRELLTARWLSNHLVAEEIVLNSESSQETESSTKGKMTSIVPTELAPLPVFADSVNKAMFERLVTDIQLGLVNKTNLLLEIDLLRPEIQKSLCHSIVKRLSETVDRIPIAKTVDRDYSEYLKALWLWTLGYFLEQHYGQLRAAEEEQLTTLAEQDFLLVNNNIFNYIYGVAELIEYLNGKPSITIDNLSYNSDDSEAIIRMELILNNLVVHLANAVIQIILNNFYDLEEFKYKLYKSEYKSDRELARFRNQLSWRYRQERYFTHPQNIFESRHRLLVFDAGKIRTFYIYAPRKAELEQLTGIPWFTTIVIEFRDAIAPLVRRFIALVGSGVVFVLTQVIGKGLGLIGKGIIQGIGSTIKDVNYKNYKGDR
ncbi:MAG: DUF3685 domain-containing protein [Pleurocapsa sp. MO_226.B13]|nr:DUF3685 domain-containing protein [Pleurocapsa sp. MO_226.B13]